MRSPAVLLSIALMQGCASDSDENEPESKEERAERKCREYIGALCGQYVRCHVVNPSLGSTFTDDTCDAALPAAVADCVADSVEEIARANDQELDACTHAVRGQACDRVCNRIPEAPTECLALEGYEPPTGANNCMP